MVKYIQQSDLTIEEFCKLEMRGDAILFVKGDYLTGQVKSVEEKIFKNTILFDHRFYDLEVVVVDEESKEDFLKTCHPKLKDQIE